jgi:hypothetical protein
MEPRLLRRRLKSKSTAACRVPGGQQSINIQQALSLRWNRNPAVRVIYVAALPQLQWFCLCALTSSHIVAASSAARKRKCCSPAVMDIWPPPDKRLGVLCHSMYTCCVVSLVSVWCGCMHVCMYMPCVCHDCMWYNCNTPADTRITQTSTRKQANRHPQAIQ